VNNFELYHISASDPYEPEGRALFVFTDEERAKNVAIGLAASSKRAVAIYRDNVELWLAFPEKDIQRQGYVLAADGWRDATKEELREVKS